MKITSKDFLQNQQIPDKFTCDGLDINPSLQISDFPEGTKSWALIVDDPDAPMGLWTHWMVWNISPEVKEIKEGSTPVGAIEGITSNGSKGYHGPCPPSGTHRYFFHVYALDETLQIPPDVSREELDREIGAHLLEKAELMGTYRR